MCEKQLVKNNHICVKGDSAEQLMSHQSSFAFSRWPSSSMCMIFCKSNQIAFAIVSQTECKCSNFIDEGRFSEMEMTDQCTMDESGMLIGIGHENVAVYNTVDRDISAPTCDDYINNLAFGPSDALNTFLIQKNNSLSPLLVNCNLETNGLFGFPLTQHLEQNK